jgi:hypothetical protein
MRVIREGASGEDVRLWETFLTGLGFYPGEVNGVFDRATNDATKAFQAANGLVADGVVGNKTLGVAISLGLPVVADPSVAEEGPDWPPPPALQPLISTEARAKAFGRFTFVPAPTAGNPEAIRLTDNWYNTNVSRVLIPQLAGVPGAPHDGSVLFHKHGVKHLTTLFNAWQQAGLIDLVLSWGGSYAPRFVRGSRTYLSNHAFASAFDINVAWNPLGSQPALVGHRGSVRKLVPIANSLGFFWGGHFGYKGKGRADGMHFELAEVD